MTASGLAIAHAILAAPRYGMTEEYIHVDDSTRASVRLHLDDDYVQGLLVSVFTKTDTGEWVDYLAICDGPNSAPAVEWWNHGRLFFDTTSWYVEDAAEWFVHWYHDLRRDESAAYRRQNPEHAAMTLEHNYKIMDEHRAKAIAAGAVLTYLDDDDLDRGASHGAG